MSKINKRFPAALIAAAFAASIPLPAHGQSTLSMNEALAVALGDQPATEAFRRDAEASEQAAAAARTLPDPQLTVGVVNFPVNGPGAFRPAREEMTMYTIGVMREQVRRSRREAEASRLHAEAVVSRAEATAEERRIQREVMVAWIDAVEAQAKQRLLDRLIADLKAGRAVIEAGIPTGSSTPALALEAQAEIALAEAVQTEARGAEARARAELARWIGPAARRPLPDTVPALAPPIVAGDAPILGNHPAVRVAEAQERAAQRQVDVKRGDRRPNLTWSAMYGWRPEYGDMVTVQVTVPLQINKGRLQNRRIAEAALLEAAARLRTENARRELGGAYGAALADYKSADARLLILVNRAIPALEASFQLAEARYAAGQGTLELPLTIVRRYVETTVQSIEERAKRARAAAELIYLAQDVIR